MLVEAGSSQIPQSVVIHCARALETEYPALFVSDVRHGEAAGCEDKEAILSKIADIEELCEHRHIVIFGAGAFEPHAVFLRDGDFTRGDWPRGLGLALS